MCDSAGETGEGDVEKFLIRVLLLLPQAPEDRRKRGRKEAHNEVPEALCTGNTAGVKPGSLLRRCPDYVVVNDLKPKYTVFLNQA